MGLVCFGLRGGGSGLFWSTVICLEMRSRVGIGSTNGRRGGGCRRCRREGKRGRER